MAGTFPENDDSEAINEDREIDQAVAELEGIRPPPSPDSKSETMEERNPADETPFDELSTEEVAEQLRRSGSMVIDTCMDIRRGENVLIV